MCYQRRIFIICAVLISADTEEFLFSSLPIFHNSHQHRAGWADDGSPAATGFSAWNTGAVPDPIHKAKPCFGDRAEVIRWTDKWKGKCLTTAMSLGSLWSRALPEPISFTKRFVCGCTSMKTHFPCSKGVKKLISYRICYKLLNIICGLMHFFNLNLFFIVTLCILNTSILIWLLSCVEEAFRESCLWITGLRQEMRINSVTEVWPYPLLPLHIPVLLKRQHSLKHCTFT